MKYYPVGDKSHVPNPFPDVTYLVLHLCLGLQGPCGHWILAGTSEVEEERMNWEEEMGYAGKHDRIFILTEARIFSPSQMTFLFLPLQVHFSPLS